MKATDLMIGDWVLVFPDQCRVDGIICLREVHTAEEKWMAIVHIGGNKYERVNVDILEPILLTPEILKKNGWKYEFDKKKYMVRYDLKNEGKDCWMMWSIDEKTLDLQRQDADLREMYNLCAQRVVIPCNYVHELQHALCLCGIDKEIVL